LIYAVEILPTALRELERARPDDMRRRLVAAIDRLAVEPMSRANTVLEGGLGLRRVRVGDWRIVYRVDAGARRVNVVIIAHRREVYRRLGRRGRT
jgi:mRNA interferase RelE/StbE